MQLTAFLRMVDEEVKASPVRMTWTLTLERSVVKIQFDSWDNYRVSGSVLLDAVDYLRENDLRYFVRRAVLGVAKVQIESRGPFFYESKETK